jgi:hypothetical protein
VALKIGWNFAAGNAPLPTHWVCAGSRSVSATHNIAPQFGLRLLLAAASGTSRFTLGLVPVSDQKQNDQHKNRQPPIEKEECLMTQRGQSQDKFILPCQRRLRGG